MKTEDIHLVIISQYFPPDVSGGSTRAYNYAKCLADQNYKVTVIDNLSTGNENLIPAKSEFVNCNIYESEKIKSKTTK